MEKFSDSIDKEKYELPVLPLMHTCDVYTLREILLSRILKTKECDVFQGEQLLYTYYGKPAYRLNHNDSTSNISFFPVCFILSPNIKIPKKIYPFDSGAFEKSEEFRKAFFHPKMKLKDFELSKIKQAGQKIVSKFYTTNLRYYNGRSSIEIENIQHGDLELLSYAAMLQNNSNSHLDNRISTIEYIFDIDFMLNDNNLLGVILPGTFLDDSSVNSILNDELKINFIKPYETSRGNPNEFHGVIVNEIAKYLDLQK